MLPDAPAPPPPAAPKHERPGLVDVLVGPLSAKAVLAQVLTGLLVGGLVFGTAGGLLLVGDRAEQADERSAVIVTGGSIGRVQAQTIADELGWTVTRAVHEGAGINRVTPNRGPNLTAQVRNDAEVKRADIVVVQGGEADTRESPSGLDTAALHLLDWVSMNKAEGATFVLVGPVPGTEQSPADLQGVDAVLRKAAGKRGIAYLSPIKTGLARNEPTFGDELVVQLRRLAAAKKD